MYNIKFKSLPICFNVYFVLPSKVHSYSTRFVTGDSHSLTRFNKSNSQRSIRYQGPKIWNELPADIKNIAQKNKHVFIKKIKEFLHVNQKITNQTFKLAFSSFAFSCLFFMYINCIQYDLQLIRLCFMHVVLLSCVLYFCRVYLLQCFRNSGWSLRHLCCSFLCFYNSVFIN